MALKKKSSFLGKVTKDAERQQKAAASYGYLLLPKGVNIFNPDPSGNKSVLLDFIPYKVTDAKHPDRNDEDDIATVGSLWYKRPYKVHRNVGVDNDTIVCPTSIKKPCPICEHRAKRMKEDADKEELKSLKASWRNLYVVVPKGNKKFEEVPHIFDISQFLFQELLNKELQETPENGIFPDLEEGKTLKVRFDSNTIGSSKPFAEASRIDFMERDEAYTEDILEDVPNLDEILNIISYKEIEAKFFEIDDEEEDGGKLKDDEEEDGGKLKDDEEEENEEEEEKPKRTKYTKDKAHPKKNEEEEEETEEEDEEEEKKPTSKVHRTHKAETKDKSDHKDKCPYGHKFGVDTDEYDECATCKLWDPCIEKKEASQ